jgi:preprotein translocase subunit SecD
MSENRRRNRRILIAVMAAISAAAIVVPVLGVLVAPGLNRDSATPITTTTTAPPLTIKPLSVRPVVSAFVTTPDQCPPPTPAPPDQPMRICDIAKTAVYELQPEALRVQLVNVDSFKNPLTGVELVQMSMTDESAQQFGRFTAGQVGKQVAFVRAGTVVWGPKISAPIDGQVLQLSGELTPEQAKEIARMLRDET